MARWSDLAQWRGPSPNITEGWSQRRGLVVHIASGFYEGTISWQKNPDANVSSHFVIDRDGTLAQVVDTADTAWTQGDGNKYWMSVECAGFGVDDPMHDDYPGWEWLTPQQIEGIAKLLERGHREYGYPLELAGSPDGRGLGYHSMGAENGENWGHSQCPGESIKSQLPEILARAQEIASGEAPGRIGDRMWTGQVLPGSATTVVCLPWDMSQISFGCDEGHARLRVARHRVAREGQPAQWFVDTIEVDQDDDQRTDLPPMEGIDRIGITRTATDEADTRDTPVGYLAWLV
jgi:hypothetical protein